MRWLSIEKPVKQKEDFLNKNVLIKNIELKERNSESGNFRMKEKRASMYFCS